MSASWFADLLASSRFLARYPQFAGVVAEMEPMATSEVASMAIARHWHADGRVVLRLYVNTDYFRQEPRFFPAFLLHEIHHAICGHLDDDRLHRVEHPLLMELAMEVAADEFITPPRPGAWLWRDYQEWGLGAGQSTMQRYELLQAAQAAGQLRIVTDEQLDAIMPGWRRRSPGATAPGSGPRILVMPKQRSILPWNNRPRLMPAMQDEHRPGRIERLGGRGVGDSLDRRGDGARPTTWGSPWLSAPTDASWIAQWQLRIRAHLRGEAGGVGDARRLAAAVAKELPRQVALSPGRGLAWARILQRLLRSQRAAHPSYLRVNRRFPDRLGELPGRKRRRTRPRLLVGVDTSASMTSAAMGRALVATRQLQRLADCTVAEVDAAVQRVHHGAVEIVVGGGDTDFHPLFALLEGRADFAAVVYFTDGVGPWPQSPPALPVLWVLTGELAFDCPWGMVVRLPADAT